MKPDEMVRQAISSDELFEQYSVDIVQGTVTNKLSFTKRVVSSIKKQIKGKKTVPPEKLRALNLLHLCLLKRSPHVLKFVQKKIMSRLCILASFQTESADQSLGKSIFGTSFSDSEENRAASAQFLTNLVTYIKIWAAQCPTNPNGELSVYSKTLVQLQRSGVWFPSANSHNAQHLSPHNADRMNMSAQTAHPEEPQQPNLNAPEPVQASQEHSEFRLKIPTSDISDPESICNNKTGIQKSTSEVENILKYTENSRDIQVLSNSDEQIQAFTANSQESSILLQKSPSQSSPQATSDNHSQQTDKTDLFDLENSKYEHVADINEDLNEFNDLLNLLQVVSIEKEATVKTLSGKIGEMRGAIAPRKPDEPLTSIESFSDRDEDTEEARDEDTEGVRDEDIEEVRDEDTEKVRDEDIEEVRDEDTEEVRDEDIERISDEDIEKISDEDIEEVRDENIEKVTDEDIEEVRDEEPLEITNLQLCKECFCCNKGIIYEDTDLKIKICIEDKDNSVIANIYIGNKTSEPIAKVLTEIQNSSNSQIDRIASTDLLEKGQQTNRTVHFAFNLSQISKTIPLLKVTIKRSFTQKLLLRLPISVVRLFNPYTQDSSSILEDWNSLYGLEKPVPILLDSAISLTELATRIALAGTFKVFSNEQIPGLGKGELMGVGILQEFKAFIKVSIGSSKKAILKVRCQNITLRDVLCGLVVEQLTEEVS